MPFRVIVSKRILNRQLIRHFSTQQSQTKIEKIQTDLKQQLDLYINKFNQASDKLKQLTSDVSNSQEALQKASRALNELTGYNHIETVKQKVTRQSELFEATREDVQIAKREYERAIETRSNTQRNINELLQRKHLWTADDVTHFTELYRLEHAHTQAEAMAKERYQSCEKQMDREYMELARSIMERYHEEQLWSDKIRSASTYGTWALMGLNLILFVTVQTVFEPRKRKRLTDRFEELLVAKVDEEEQKWGHVFESLNEKDKVLMEQQVLLMEAVNSLSEHPLFDDVVLQSLRQFETPQIQAPVAQLSDIPVLEISPEMDVQIPDEVIPQETVISNNDNELGNTKRVDQWHSIQSAIAGGLVTAIAIYFLN